MKVVLILMMTVLLAGCFEERIVTSSKVVTMEVVSVTLRNKSHSTVNLKVIGANQVYTDQRLSCRRSEAERVKIGSKWDVHVEEFKRGDRYGTTVLGTHAICTLSQ